MGGQSGDIGYNDGPPLCRCGAVLAKRRYLCESCEELRDERARLAQARREDKKHRAAVEQLRAKRLLHTRKTKTYHVNCDGCGEVFHTRSKVRRVCSGCSAKAPGFRRKMADAFKRGIGFRLTIDDWNSLQGVPCFYCGDTFTGVRVDRVNSDGAYTRANVVSCCTPCNMMKHTMPVDIFYARIAKIAAHLNAATKETA